MKPEDFRKFMITQIRGFDSWVWKDNMDNPEGWAEPLSKAEWLQLFLDYIGDEFV